MAKPGSSQMLMARLLSAILLSAMVWLILSVTLQFFPFFQEFLEQKKLEPYVTALAQGDLKHARSVFDRDLQRQASDPSAYVTIARACVKTGHPDLAIEYLNKSLVPCKDAPRPVRALLYGTLSECYSMVEKTKPQEQSILAAQRAAELDPSSPRWLNTYGYLLADNDIQLDEAVQLTSQALQLLKKSPGDDPTMACQIEDSYGWALYKKGNYDAAVGALNQAIADVPRELMDSPMKGELLTPLYYHLGAASRRQGKTDVARQALQTALTYSPGNKEAKAELDDLNSHSPPAPGSDSPQQGSKPDKGTPAKLKPKDAKDTNGATVHPSEAHIASASGAKDAEERKPAQKDVKTGSVPTSGPGVTR